MSYSDAPTQKLPGVYQRFAARFPAMVEAHQRASDAAAETGPLDARTCELIKIGICVGAGLESALRSHVRRAMLHGATQVEIEQAIMLGMTTCGFPRTVTAWNWAQIQFERDRNEKGEGA